MKAAVILIAGITLTTLTFTAGADLARFNGKSFEASQDLYASAPYTRLLAALEKGERRRVIVEYHTVSEADQNTGVKQRLAA